MELFVVGHREKRRGGLIQTPNYLRDCFGRLREPQTYYGSNSLSLSLLEEAFLAAAAEEQDDCTSPRVCRQVLTAHAN